MAAEEEPARDNLALVAAQDEEAEKAYEAFVAEGARAEMSYQPHVVFQETIKAEREKSKTEAADNQKLREATEQAIAKTYAKTKARMTANPEVAEKIC